MLSDDYLQEAEQRARRFSGAYTGTSGTLAADSLRILADLKTIKQENRRMAEQLAEIDTQGPIHDPDDQEVEDRVPSDWILRGERELKREQAEPRLPGDGLLRDETPQAERLLLDAVDIIRQRRATYGPPGQGHFAKTVGMINALFAHKLREPLTQAEWAQIMILDKLARYQGPTRTVDGPLDIAGYAACLAEVEATSPAGPSRPR